jgi:hypothetical protein
MLEHRLLLALLLLSHQQVGQVRLQEFQHHLAMVKQLFHGQHQHQMVEQQLLLTQ